MLSSSPWSLRKSATSSSVAPGPISMAIGSPGTTRGRTNTTTATPSSVGIASSNR